MFKRFMIIIKNNIKNYLKKEFIDCAKNENLKYEWIKNYKSS
jgi:hypothetical protein